MDNCQSISMLITLKLTLRINRENSFLNESIFIRSENSRLATTLNIRHHSYHTGKATIKFNISKKPARLTLSSIAKFSLNAN